MPSMHGDPAAQAWLRLSPARVRIIVRLIDVGLIVGVAAVANQLLDLGQENRALFWFAVACAVLVALDLFAAAGLYRPRDLGKLRRQVRRVVVAWSAVQAILLLLATVAGSTEAPSVSFFLTWWTMGLAALLGLHVATALLVRRGQQSGWLATRLVLVGAGPLPAHLISKLRRLDPGVVILGLFDDRRSRVPTAIDGCPVLGTLDDLSRYASTHLV